ncbi:Rieske 2Fe-2S domain-containing protein [Labrys sp. KB_33_2]|uniref:Rieske 2Fe-2S domain-containing protein n=1 Tax=Labrys sp. KB_33_2 TaxID=3237479 RepID=UPI003F8EBC39
MLIESDNRLITQTGRGTPMGSLMRQYWVPILRSSQLRVGDRPHRLTIFGDRLVAFRTPNGQVGVMDEACPHRGASLALGRVEECGLRCIYHGWLMAPSGEVMEAPTHPADADLHNLPSRGYPVREGQGMIWAWFGKGEKPAFPILPFTNLPDSHVLAATAVVNCSWLHPLETLWDVFHAQILHNQTNRASSRAKVYFSKTGRRAGGLEFDYPEMRVTQTDYGFTYTNADAAKETNHHYVAPFMLFHTITPPKTDDKAVQISIPIDDDHCLLWMVFYNRYTPLKSDGYGWKFLGDCPDLDDIMEGMGERTPANRWGQNRASMESGESYVGIMGMGGVTILAEDIMVVESQGRADRSRDVLAPTDRALVQGRRTLINAVHAYERGEPPFGQGLDLDHLEAVFTPKQPATAAE